MVHPQQEEVAGDRTTDSNKLMLAIMMPVFDAEQSSGNPGGSAIGTKGEMALLGDGLLDCPWQGLPGRHIQAITAGQQRCDRGGVVLTFVEFVEGNGEVFVEGLGDDGPALALGAGLMILPRNSYSEKEDKEDNKNSYVGVMFIHVPVILSEVWW